MVIAVLVVALVAEVVVGVLVYQQPDRVNLAVISAASAIVLLAVVDWAVRGHDDDPRRPRWFRPFLPFWCFVPFVCALAGSWWMHYQQREQALDEIDELVLDIHAQHPVWDSPDAVYKAIDTLAEPRFKHLTPKPESDDKAQPHGRWTRERNRFVQLARVVGEDMRHIESCRAGYMPMCLPAVRDGFSDGTITSYLLPLGLQSLLILWFPALLAVSIRVSLRRLDQAISDRDDNMRWCLDARDYRIVAEGQALFIPRLFFAMILLLGTNYVMSPIGMKATYLMAAVDEHGLPGQTSYSLWSTDFTEAPVVAIGFVGYLLYAIITATQRFIVRDLDDRSLLALLVRGVLVLLLSLALSATEVNDIAARAFVFIAGIFPIRALESLAKRVNIAMDPDFGGSTTNSFEGIPNLDPAKVFAMRAAGIESVSDLATMPIRDIAERVRVDLHLLGRVVDRAVLIDAIGLDLAKCLVPLGVTSATELVDLDEANLAIIVEKLGRAPALVAKRLRNDARLAELRRWVTDPNSITDEERDRAKLLREAALPAINRRLDELVSSVSKSTPDASDALRAEVADLKKDIKKAGFLTVHLHEFNVSPSTVELPYAAYNSFTELCDDIFYRLRGHVQLYQYGREWSLHVLGQPTDLQHARQIQRRGYGRPVDDRRSLDTVGIRAGDEIEVRKLDVSG